jgi:pyruvate formate lyase activating enzyme
MIKEPKLDNEDLEYLTNDLSNCKLCEWKCGINRIDGEMGVCGITIPEVSSSQLHPAPPASFDAFMIGCSFRCLSCQNWPVANFPVNDYYDSIEGYYQPGAWAELALANLASPQAKSIGADRLFFTGGEPTCSLPWIEEVVKAAQKIEEGVKVNFDTNGYMTKTSLNRILVLSDSLTFDIKAYDEKLFRALTGADVEVVLRNAEHVVKHAKDKLWEFRILVIPGIHNNDLEGLCNFIAGMDTNIPVNFLAFRPNFVMGEHPWTQDQFMADCLKIAKKGGLTNVSWSGRVKESGVTLPPEILEYKNSVNQPANIAIAMGYALQKGCVAESLRHCGTCKAVDKCLVKRYSTDRLH